VQTLFLRVLLIVALSASCSACASNAKAAALASPSPLPQVTTATAVHATISPTLQIAGVIAPYRQVGVAADLTEPISEVDVQEGDHVKAGQVLARLQVDDLQAQLASAQRVVGEDVARYKQTSYQTTATNGQDVAAIRSAQATLHQAQVNEAGAQTDLNRYVRLANEGYLPTQTVDEQRTTVASDAAAVSSAQAALNQATANSQANGTGGNAGEQQQELEGARAAVDAAQASVDQLQRQLARAVIVAPVAGIVDSVNANPGEYPTQRQLFTIEQIASVYAVLPSSTMQVVQIQPGAVATIVAANSPHKDSGKVVAVLDQVQPGTTNFTVKVLVPNADYHLHAGIPVTGTVQEPSVSGIRIPLTAFVDDTRTSVYAIEDGVVKTQKVAEVKDDGTNAIVTGLTSGTRVIADVENANVGNGDRVSTGK
jgi:HlyD family secretion protein